MLSSYLFFASLRILLRLLAQAHSLACTLSLFRCQYNSTHALRRNLLSCRLDLLKNNYQESS